MADHEEDHEQDHKQERKDRVQRFIKAIKKNHRLTYDDEKEVNQDNIKKGLELAKKLKKKENKN